MHTDWTACTATSKTFFNCDNGQSAKCDTVAVTLGQRKMNLVERLKKQKKKKKKRSNKAPFKTVSFYTNLQKQVEKTEFTTPERSPKKYFFFFWVPLSLQERQHDITTW